MQVIGKRAHVIQRVRCKLKSSTLVSSVTTRLALSKTWSRVAWMKGNASYIFTVSGDKTFLQNTHTSQSEFTPSPPRRWFLHVPRHDNLTSQKDLYQIERLSLLIFWCLLLYFFRFLCTSRRVLLLYLLYSSCSLLPFFPTNYNHCVS